jgi:hypothetical protein
MTPVNTVKRTDRGQTSAVLTTLYALNCSIALICFAAYKVTSVDHPMTLFANLGACGIAISLALLARVAILWRRSPRAAAVAMTVNFLTLLLVFGISEGALRALEHATDSGVAVGNIELRPTWPEVVDRNRNTGIDSAQATYFIYDRDLGWVVGANRQSANNLYFSSAEGIRSDRPDVAYADQRAAKRVALIGDSNAFSLEVGYQDSLGHQLGQLLDDSTQVLNFGVDGYGIDQIFLRYKRDVRPWKPRVVVIVFIQHDLMRTMAVYPFISFGWSGYLVKPRFDLVDDELRIVNAPLPRPDEILKARAPRDLPYVDYDPGFVNSDWDWRLESGPLVLRLLTSLSPPWPDRQAQGHADTSTLNQRLLQALVASIENDGATAVVVYLPQWIGSDSLARSALAQSKLPFIDMTECVMRVPAERRRVASGHHYTGEGNQAIAKCALPPIRSALEATATTKTRAL